MSLLKRLEQGKEGGPERADSPAGGGGQRLSTLQARRTAPPGGPGQRDTYMDLKTRVQNRLLAELDPGMDITIVEEELVVCSG